MRAHVYKLTNMSKGTCRILSLWIPRSWLRYGWQKANGFFIRAAQAATHYLSSPSVILVMVPAVSLGIAVELDRMRIRITVSVRKETYNTSFSDHRRQLGSTSSPLLYAHVNGRSVCESYFKMTYVCMYTCVYLHMCVCIYV